MTTETKCNAVKVRRLAIGDPSFLDALHLAVGARRDPRSGAPAPEVAEMIASVREERSSIEFVAAAYLDGGLSAACVALETPGSVALVLMSGPGRKNSEHEAAFQVLSEVAEINQRRGVALLEALVSPGDRITQELLQRAGFRHLTQLVYLSRGSTAAHPVAGKSEVDWLSYAPDREDLFRQAIEATYVQTLDCPELSGARTTEQVLAGHRTTGKFDPGLWWLGMRDGQPVGVVLLNRIPAEPGVELVYMGVAQPMRGRGVAHALLARALEVSDSIGARFVALAVDRRNMPARRLYQRWGFLETARREVWIATPPRR